MVSPVGNKARFLESLDMILWQVPVGGNANKGCQKATIEETNQCDR